VETESRAERRPRRHSTAAEVGIFAASGLAALAVLAIAGVDLLRHIGTREAVRDAKQLTALAGRGIVEPVATGLVEGSPGARARVDRVVRARVLRGGVVRVKIWSEAGRVVYSDEPRIVGSTYPLGADERAALHTGAVDAEVSDLRAPENRFERRYGKLLEVYLPIRDDRGRRLLFETYQRFSSVSSSGRHLWLAFAPAILGALLLLELVQVPLALGLARRLRRGQEARELLLRHAIESSDIERRRIAHDLHDGAVQSLAGVSYSLAAAAERVDTTPAETVARTLRDAAAGTRQTIRELRTLLVDIYPPDLHRTGLEAALRDLVAPLPPRGIEADVHYADGDLPPELEALFYRGAQEALRNVVSHSRASRVRIDVASDGSHARLTVADDGVGFEAEAAASGHFGLRLLEDLAREAGGTLDVSAEPGRGTRLTIEAPVE
jgi:two-component system NarL family sensor kinase